MEKINKLADEFDEKLERELREEAMENVAPWLDEPMLCMPEPVEVVLVAPTSIEVREPAPPVEVGLSEGQSIAASAHPSPIEPKRKRAPARAQKKKDEGGRRKEKELVIEEDGALDECMVNMQATRRYKYISIRSRDSKRMDWNVLLKRSWSRRVRSI